MDKQPNLYERFLKDIHPELIDQFKNFIKEKDIYKQFIKFAHPEFDKDFKKYTAKMPAINSYRIARFYVDHPDFPKNYYYLDVGVEEQTGKYILLDKEGKPLNNYSYDNIGILSYAAGWKKTSYFGIYVKKGDSYAFLKKSEKDEELLDFPTQGKVLSDFLDYGLPHYKFPSGSRDDRIYQMFAGMEMQWLKDETIILDKNTKLVPDFEPDSYHTTAYRLGVKVGKDDWEATNIFYVGKVPDYRSGDNKDRLLSTFLDKWNKADNKQKAELRKGLGYTIGFR